MRQIEMAAAIGEAELQDAHAGHAKVFAQLIDFFRDQAKVFGDEGEVAEDLLQSVEERVAWSLDPLAVDGGLFVGGDGPVRFEAAEVVKADFVVEGQRAANASDPPVEAVLLEQRPLVERIAPALAGCGEVIRRNARDADGLKAVVKLEDLRMRPDIGAVVADKDGNIAEDANPALGAVSSQSRPLFVEEELNDLLDGELASAFVHETGEGVGLAAGELGGPLVPAEIVEAAAQHTVHRVVGEPGNVVLAEPLEAEAVFLRSAIKKVGRRFFDQRNLLVEGRAEVAGALVSGQTAGALSMRSSASQPSRTRNSRLMSRGLPAKAESAE